MRYQIEQEMCGIDQNNKYAASNITTNTWYQIEQQMCGTDQNNKYPVSIKTTNMWYRL